MGISARTNDYELIGEYEDEEVKGLQRGRSQSFDLSILRGVAVATDILALRGVENDLPEKRNNYPLHDSRMTSSEWEI